MLCWSVFPERSLSLTYSPISSPGRPETRIENGAVDSHVFNVVVKFMHVAYDPLLEVILELLLPPGGRVPQCDLDSFR